LAGELVRGDHDSGLARAYAQPHRGVGCEIDDRDEVTPRGLVHSEAGGDDDVPTCRVTGEVFGRNGYRDATECAGFADDQGSAAIGGEGPPATCSVRELEEAGVLSEPTVGDGDTPGTVLDLVDDSRPVICGEQGCGGRHM